MAENNGHPPNSGFMSRFLFNAFGHPRGLAGKIGGFLMARSNGIAAEWLIDFLAVQSTDHVLEVGFGPGVAIELLSHKIIDGKISGIDISQEMVAMATTRNQDAIVAGNVVLQEASVIALPYEANQFNKMLAINSMQLWPDVEAGLHEVYRVMQSGGVIALGFTPRAQPRPKQEKIATLLTGTGFKNIKIETKEEMICVLGEK